MIEVYSKALDEHIEVDRIIGRVDAKKPGPCLVFVGGIHGNEPSGVFALHTVMEALQKKDLLLKGSVVAFAGNLGALQRSERYRAVDLNRQWVPEKIEALKAGTFVPQNEDEQQQEDLYRQILRLLSNEKGPFYFFDLHTTSSKSTPFLTVNDSLLNRKFAQQYPAPMILGIEEYLNGPMLSYINELGYVAFGFESGQHDDRDSVDCHIAFIYLSLVFAGVLDPRDIPFHAYWQMLNRGDDDIYEIYYRYQIKDGEQFVMEPNYINFQPIFKGELLAKSNGHPVRSVEDTKIFMPLYQAQGDDGFFLIRKIPSIFLRLSSWMRRWRVDRILPFLPGIQWLSDRRDIMIVDLRTARFLAKPFLHLMGYRNKELDKDHLLIRNREDAARYEDYRDASWLR